MKTGITIAGVPGSATLESHNDCAADGDAGCVVIGPAFKAAAMVNVVNSNIKTGVTIAGVTGNITPSPASCASDGAGSCVVDGTDYKAAKLSNFVAGDVKTGVTIAGVPGSATLESHNNCAADGGVGCVTDGTNYKAAKLSNFAGADVKTGITIAGIPGSATLESHNNCAADGASGCITDGTNYKAAKLSNFAGADVKTGITIAGVPGSATLESHNNCAADGEAGCVVLGPSFKAADMSLATEANIKSGVSIAGIAGKYPSASYPLAGADITDDLDAATFNTKIKSASTFEWFDSIGTRYTHTGDPDITSGLILSGVSIFGTVGTYVPGAMNISNFKGTKSPGKITLSWTRTGGSGIIIVRRVGASVTFTPSHGVSYAQGYTSGSDEVIYKGSGAAVDDTDVVELSTYYYKAFAYNDDNAYSAVTNEASVFYVDGEACGGVGDSCYDNTAAQTAGFATTPLGKRIEYVTASGGFKVWKEIGTNKILRPTGLDEWAKKLNLNGKGISATNFTDYASITGRRCPINVYIDDSNKFTTGNCLYYTSEVSTQGLNAAGTSQTVDGNIGLNDWSNYNGGVVKWYVGNIQTCASKGMRLPTVFETSVADTTIKSDYPTADGTPTLAGATNGIPHSGGNTWTATSLVGFSGYYWLWSTATSPGNYPNAYSIKCVLP